MILADTSVWVDHFRNGNSRLRDLLQAGEVAMHSMVLGELACGNLPQRELTIYDLKNLPLLGSVSDQMVLEMVDRRTLWGKGIGWIDAHMLSAALVSNVALWTLDRRLAAAATAVGVLR